MNRSNASAWLIACSILGLTWVLASRVFGPSDLWDHTQPRTVSYTTDILVNGGSHWILPVERGEEPATKPPMYNWAAAPWVRWLGFNSEIAHKMPSVIAFCLCWLIVVRIGRGLAHAAPLSGSSRGESLGWLAGLIAVANYTIFKLAYLARPDMLLTLWLLGAWALATQVLLERDEPPGARRRWMVVGYWTCIALAGLTKGPAALVGIVYPLLAARWIAGSWSAVRLLRPVAGFTLSTLVIGLWAFGVWKINPEHLRDELWREEIYGRVTGTGSKGNHHGPSGLVIDLPLHVFYYILRFLPWSACSFFAMCLLWRKSRVKMREPGGCPKPVDPVEAWMRAAAAMVLVVVGLFTLSAGKRADYLAAAYPAGSFLAAWWSLVSGPRWMVRRPWLAPAAAFIVLGAMTVTDRRETGAPMRGFGDGIREFIDQAHDRIAAEPLPVVFYGAGESQLQAMLGASTIDSRGRIWAMVNRNEAFWMIAGLRIPEPTDAGVWLRKVWGDSIAVEAVVRSRRLVRDEGWPEEVTLFKVSPRPGVAEPASSE